MKKTTLKTAFLFCGVLLFNTVLLASLYQKTWAPHEDGYFAHVAERLLNGEKLFRDVESRHAGYIHFVNTAALSAFGPTMAAPRIPVSLITLIQSSILFFLLISAGWVPAVLAAFSSTILGYLQCLTPSTHWYCLFFLTLMITALIKIPQSHKLRLPLLGFLLGLIILFRQLTGFFAVAGLLTYLLTENHPDEKNPTPLLARLLLLFSAGLLWIHFKETFEINGFVLFGLWPCFLLFWAFFHTRLSNQSALLLLIQLGLGIFLAFLPLFIYLILNGAILLWIDDTLIRPAHMLKATPYEAWSSYALYQIKGAMQIYKHQSIPLLLNGFYWFFLPLLGFFNGMLLFFYLLKKKTLSSQDALPILTVFYSMVSYTLQIPIYLYYSVGLSLISLIWISTHYYRHFKIGIITVTFFLLITACYFHAAQPSQRGMKGIMEGQRQTLFEKQTLPKLSLKIQKADGETYETLTDYIKMKTGVRDTIFVFPNNPEVYFLAERRNPYRFTLTPTALQNAGDIERTAALLNTNPPRMILYNPGDKYNSPFTPMLLEEIRKNYILSKTIPPFEIYEKNP